MLRDFFSLANKSHYSSKTEPIAAEETILDHRKSVRLFPASWVSHSRASSVELSNYWAIAVSSGKDVTGKGSFIDSTRTSLLSTTLFTLFLFLPNSTGRRRRGGSSITLFAGRRRILRGSLHTCLSVLHTTLGCTLHTLHATLGSTLHTTLGSTLHTTLGSTLHTTLGSTHHATLRPALASLLSGR